MITMLLEIGLSNALLATALAAIALVLTRRMRPQLALAVWLLVLAKLLMPPLWTVPLGSLQVLVPVDEPREFVAWNEAELPLASVPLAESAVPMDFEIARPVVVEQVNSDAAASKLALPLVVFAAWGLGIAAWCGVAVRRVRAFGALLRHTRRAPTGLQREVQWLAASLNLRDAPEVRFTGRRIAPLVWGFGRPGVLLLPATLWHELSGDERQVLLLHELTHLRRRDHLTKFLELAAVAVYWWLPTAWWVRRQTDRATERCCDAEVVAQMPELSHGYASALIKTIDFLSESTRPLPLGASGFSQFGLVSRRIEMILNPLPATRMPWKMRLALLAGAICVFPISIESLWAEPRYDDHSATESDPGDASTLATRDGSDDAAPTAPPEIETLSQLQMSKWFSRENLEKAREECAELAATGGANIQIRAKLRDELRQQLAAHEKAFAAETVTLEQLLTSQRKFAAAEIALAYAVCPHTPVGRERLLQRKFLSATDEIARATRIWETVRRRAATTKDAGSAEEAQAREQVQHFKQQIREVVNDAYSVPAFESNARILRSMLEALDQDKVAATDRRIYSIKGAPTSSTTPLLDPPSDDALLILFRYKCCDDRQAFPTEAIRIVKQPIATYNAPPVSYPAIGAAFDSHTLYKCKMHFKDSAGDAATDTMYVDHHHLRQVEETASGPTPRAGKNTATIARGGSFESSDGNVKDWNDNTGELLGGEIIRQAKAELAKLEASDESNVAQAVERRDLARRELERLEKELKASRVPLERLLKAQQELASDEASLVDIVCPATTEGTRLRFQAQLLLANDALNRARRTWQQVYARYRTGNSGKEARDEAQAREQFYQFKLEYERARNDYQQELDKATSSNHESTPRSSDQSVRESETEFQAELNRVSIAGPVTAGSRPEVLDPPSDDEVRLH
jgi:beta-lactamase regulating signal transducer with metallopeptidase domain